MDYLNTEETIVALSTPYGEGAIAIIRVTGRDAIDIVSKIYSGPIKTYRSHTAHFGSILNADDSILDNVLILVMKAPNSYTSEDIVEIHCHGSLLITKKILERILSSGARAALAGEFTFRAFHHKKIDLIQAEAVKDLIHAKNELALKFASSQLAGNLSQKVEKMQDSLTDIASFFEASLDFPEEDNFGTKNNHITSLEKILDELKAIIATFDNGEKLSHDFSLCILGSPNVGKSTLMNLLVGKPKAIVTPIAGTTRDILEETITFGKLSFRLIDTAGIRNTKKTIEKEGVKRAKEAFKKADFVLLMLDGTRPLNAVDKQLLDEVDDSKTVIIWNKIDIKTPKVKLPNQHVVFISAKNETNLSDLTKTIEHMILKNTLPSTDGIVITNVRHKKCLQEAYDYGEKALLALKNNFALEMIIVDIKAALNSLSNIIGQDITENILDRIFSQFCIGK